MKKTLKYLLVSAPLISLSPSTQALELIAGDYEVLPPGTTVALQYFQHAKRNKLYSNGEKQSSEFNLDSTIGITRFIHAIPLNKRTNFNANLIIPYGKLNGDNHAEFLGSGSGMSDVITGGAFEYLLNKENGDTVGIGTFIHLPTGAYDHENALNLGENRWKALIQLVYTKHIGKKFTMDIAGDVLLHGENNKYGPGKLTLKQDPRYEFQGHLSYKATPMTSLTFGLGHIRGAETKVAGISQNDELKTTYARLGITQWITPTLQYSVQYGKDIDIKNGTMEKQRINMRLAKIF